MRTSIFASMIVAALAFAPIHGFAADKENKAETSTDTSKNPITGTETTTTKSEKKMKGEHSKAETSTKKTHKKYKDGGEKTTTETTTESKHE